VVTVVDAVSSPEAGDSLSVM